MPSSERSERPRTAAKSMRSGEHAQPPGREQRPVPGVARIQGLDREDDLDRDDQGEEDDRGASARISRRRSTRLRT